MFKTSTAAATAAVKVQYDRYGVCWGVEWHVVGVGVVYKLQILV